MRVANFTNRLDGECHLHYLKLIGDAGVRSNEP